MDLYLDIIFYFLSYLIWIEAVPPEACFANFRWDDCGQDPIPVIYYWKPGSRCEVGFWRGCLPNLNMFQDEYECVATCIFTSRAGDEDYHKINALDETESSYDQTAFASTDGNSTVTLTGNTVSSDSVTGGDSGATNSSSGDIKETDSNTTGANNEVSEATTNGS